MLTRLCFSDDFHDFEGFLMSLIGSYLATIIHKLFETNSSFNAK